MAKALPKTQRLKKAYRQKTLEVDLLHRIIEIIGSTLELKELLSEIARMIIGVTKGDSCLIYLFDEKKEELILRGSYNPHPRLLGRIKLHLGEGITGWVAEKREPVAITENASEDPRFKFYHNLPEDRYEAFLSVPIEVRGDLVGVVNVQHKKVYLHSITEIALLSTIADLVGGAIENTRLREKAERRARQIETLAKVSRTIVSEPYPHEILKLIVTIAAEVINAKVVSLFLLQEKKGELRLEATQSGSEEYRKKPPIKVGESISGKVMKSKEPMAVLNVQREPAFLHKEIARKEGLSSFLSVPMLIKEKAIGVINCYTSEEHRFTEEEIRVLSTIANQAAVVIENTRLREEAQAAQEALETRKIIERAKGILMNKNGLSEEGAYELIQRQAMNLRKKMHEIAEAILLAEDLTKK
ncbi:GAF domain-containing protein [candidate division TA06 bacterium]|nr:GAF domain-containing protein [candidate division TA06 bacterium]